MRTRLLPAGRPIVSTVTVVSSHHPVAEGYDDEPPATIAESSVLQEEHTGSTPNAISNEPSNVSNEHQLVEDAIISGFSRIYAQQAGSDEAHQDMHRMRNPDGPSSQVSLTSEKVVPTGTSTPKMMALAVPSDQTRGNSSRKRRHAEATEKFEDDSYTLKASSSSTKRQKINPVEVDTIFTRETHTQKKLQNLLPNRVPTSRSGTQGAAKVPRSIKAVNSTNSTNAAGRMSIHTEPLAILPLRHDQFANIKGKKRAYAKTPSDSDQQAQVTGPFQPALNNASPVHMQRKEQARCNKRVRKSGIAESRPSKPSAARTDYFAETTRINNWLKRNSQSDREKQQEQRNKMLQAMSQSKSFVITEAALRNREDVCTEESHPACCRIKLTGAEADELREELGWLPVNITYITEEDIHFYDEWWT